ncbi:MAG: glycoside hydrolase family 99-like domain-containing protein [Campylobacterales bacterium]|nr:glycoside hydrolase family 99-like domain-containing protein [Campylobacterales bacterium]
MKIIAFYLPQFHTIPENDAWWGKDFTEWTNTKKSKPLFHSHYQPREPLSDYYYNLLDPKTMQWQADMAKEHGLYGFCYYHYWFNGKKLLEKPLEQMLLNKKIDIPFCLSWANEPWTRAWNGNLKEIIMPQIYGGENEWRNHFEYLSPYFLDSRYIKIDQKPVFLIYNASAIPHVNEMVAYWDALAIELGFLGIHIIETLNSYQKHSCIDTSKALVEFEPMYTLTHHYPKYLKIWQKLKQKLFFDTRSYDIVWQRVLNRDPKSIKKPIIPGAFVDWDNSARKHKHALILQGASPDKFSHYLKIQLQRAKNIYHTDFLFINAWNEWAEGTYLEPDKKHGYLYLEALQNALKKFHG